MPNGQSSPCQRSIRSVELGSTKDPAEGGAEGSLGLNP